MKQFTISSKKLGNMAMAYSLSGLLTGLFCGWALSSIEGPSAWGARISIGIVLALAYLAGLGRSITRLEDEGP